jgi:hypothetical protein
LVAPNLSLAFVHCLPNVWLFHGNTLLFTTMRRWHACTDRKIAPYTLILRFTPCAWRGNPRGTVSGMPEPFPPLHSAATNPPTVAMDMDRAEPEQFRGTRVRVRADRSSSKFELVAPLALASLNVSSLNKEQRGRQGVVTRMLESKRCREKEFELGCPLGRSTRIYPSMGENHR